VVRWSTSIPVSGGDSAVAAAAVAAAGGSAFSTSALSGGVSTTLPTCASSALAAALGTSSGRTASSLLFLGGGQAGKTSWISGQPLLSTVQTLLLESLAGNPGEGFFEEGFFLGDCLGVLLGVFFRKGFFGIFAIASRVVAVGKISSWQKVRAAVSSFFWASVSTYLSSGQPRESMFLFFERSGDSPLPFLGTTGLVSWSSYFVLDLFFKYVDTSSAGTSACFSAARWSTSIPASGGDSAVTAAAVAGSSAFSTPGFSGAVSTCGSSACVSATSTCISASTGSLAVH